MLNPTIQAVVRLPGFWRHEAFGELKPAVEAYLKRETLTLRQIALVRAYLCQWIGSGIWDANGAAGFIDRARLRDLRQRAGRIVTVADIDEWLALALNEGIDPL
jgi:hypothetical protein